MHFFSLLSNFVVAVASSEREAEKIKKTDKGVIMMRVMKTRNIAEEHGVVTVMMIEGLIGEKTEVNLILKDTGTKRDVKEEDMKVKMMVMMTVGGEKENIDLTEEEEETHLQMMRGIVRTVLQQDQRKMTGRTARKEWRQHKEKRTMKKQRSLLRRRQTQIIHCLQEQVQK